MYDAFYPGKTWLDTEGKRIQAHGGSVMYIDGTYYWYGENKEKTTGKDEIWHWGVRCYTSKDLYNWEDRGLIIPPEPENPGSSLHPSSMMDRPHIIYNKRTGKYVCWLKIMNRDGSQTETVMTADNILGPYTKVREGLRPLDMSAGDFDLAVAPGGKAYYYFERVHSETICADLTPDYTDVTVYYSTHFPHTAPPYVREATAHFYRKGKHYLVTSGTTGYLPNPSEIAVADRWVPGHMDWKYENYKKTFEQMFDPDYHGEINTEDYELDSSVDTSVADYVWLPFRFSGEMGYLDWKEEWRIEDFE
ncbi:MAG TPA: family 43 glycosylhydrolase [Candidatus Mediterraneibacter excrementigallinarum]|nr:family 43 glycosylhydrolase [Candidatus Mediterraneibacter excrementigallinarum]